MDSSQGAAPILPPPGSPPPEQDEHARTRLLNAAVHVFGRKGYAGASVREIAERAGVTKPALYYHFGSKEGVLLAILEQAQQQFAEALARAVAGSGSAQDRLIEVCEAVYRLFEENVPIARVAHAVFLGPPDGAPPFDVTVFEAHFRRAIDRITSDGVASGEFRADAARDVALAVMGILEGCNERQLHPAFEPVGTDGVRRLVNLLFDGVMNAPRA
jgi:AcrR family transcriptional regulator